MSKTNEAWLNEGTGEIFTPKCRMVWPAILVAKKNRKFPEKPAKFNVALLIPKAADIKVIVAEIGRAAAEKHGAKWKEKIKADKYPLQKTSTNASLSEFAAEFPMMLNASANLEFPPFVIGPDAKPFKGDASDVYSGRWAIVAGDAWGYDTGSNGVGWNLNRIQLLDHDEPIADGRVATAEGFEEFKVDPAKAVGGGTTSPKTADDIMNDEIPF